MMKQTVALLLLTGGLVFAQTTGINYVRTKSFPNGLENPQITGLAQNELPNGTALNAIGYFNGWAQDIQTQTLSEVNGNILIGRKFYDSRGRLLVSGKAQMISASDSLNFKDVTYTQYLGTFSNVDSTFERYGYENSTAGRIRFSMPYGTVYHNPARAVGADYFVDANLKASVTQSTDEDGQTQQVYVDNLGRKIRQVSKMASGPEDLTTIFEYDILGNLTRSTPPLGVKNPATYEVHIDSLMPYGTYNDGASALEKGQAMNAKEESWAAGGFEGLAPENDPNHPMLRFVKPNGTLSATVNISHYVASGNCGYNLNLQYRISQASGTGAWVTIGSSNATVQLQENDWKIEVRRQTLTQTGSGCTQSQIRLKLDAVATVIDTAKYSTTYWYDKRSRLVQKQSPDEGITYYVYDVFGRLRFVQDENHRSNYTIQGQRSYWTYYKYDGLGRTIEQGEVLTNHAKDYLRQMSQSFTLLSDTIVHLEYDTTYRDTMYCFEPKSYKDSKPAGGSDAIPLNCEEDSIQVITSHTVVDSIIVATVSGMYGSSSFPTTNIVPVVVNKYDNYTGTWQINVNSDTAGTKPKTRLTRTKILDPNTNTWSEEAFVYDVYGRVTKRWVYIPELAAAKKFQYYYDASGRVLKTMYQDGQSDKFYQWFRYDNLSRLDSVFSSTTNNRATASLEAVYDYDNDHGGKVKQTKLGAGIETVNYEYTVRDWLKKINDINPGAGGIVTLQNQTLSGTYTNGGDSLFMKDITVNAGSNVTIEARDGLRLQAGFSSNGATVTLKSGVANPVGGGGGGGSSSYKFGMVLSYDDTEAGSA
ncbi:MAG: hypothetical protein KDC45_10095, partial [Bacteroidetes bacterium]|nr:hypothetical protein [Bacteroidota bacterium]